MARYLLRLKARQMRKRGVSVKKIERTLGISRGTASRWVRDIILSNQQVQALAESQRKGAEIGRLKTAAIKREKRLKLLESFVLLGIETIAKLNNRDLLIAGLALYAGEGGKKDRRVEFCNSDPRVVKFLLRWLRVCFQVDPKDFRCVLGINKIHSEREETVKFYENFNSHYGTLSVVVAKSTMLYYKIMGLLVGMFEENISEDMITGNVAQW